MRELLRRPEKEYPQFEAGLSFVEHLPSAEAAALLRERSRDLADGAVPARLVYLYIPAGIEEYWQEIVQVREASGGSLDPAVLKEIGAKHGHTLWMSSER